MDSSKQYIEPPSEAGKSHLGVYLSYGMNRIHPPGHKCEMKMKKFAFGVDAVPKHVACDVLRFLRYFFLIVGGVYSEVALRKEKKRHSAY